MHASRETCRTRDAREAHLSSLARVREIRDCSPSSPWATIASSHFHFIHNSLIHSVSGVYLTLLVAIFFSHLSFVCFDSLLGHRRRSTNAVPPPRTSSVLSCSPSSFCTANMDHCHCRTGTESPCAYFTDGGRQKDHKGGPLKAFAPMFGSLSCWKTNRIAVITVEPADKICFVYSCM